MPQPLGIAPLGFSANDLDRLGKIFDHAPIGGRRYTLRHPAQGNPYDILLVNYDDPAALREKDALLQNRPHTPVVGVSHGPLPEPPAFHLRGMLIGVKVLGLLDKIPLPPPTPPIQPTSPVQPTPPVQSTPPAPPAPPPPVPEPVPPAAVATTGFRALVVDDSLAIRKSLEEHLRGLPQVSTIEFAETGEEALEKAQSIKCDLVFLDVMMPGIDGYETCARLRKLPGYKKTPIIMVSGKNSPLDEVKGVIAGCTTYLTKPVQEEAFLKLSRRVLDWLDNFRPAGGASQ